MCDLLQARVSCYVPVPIVERLEEIDIEQQDRKRRAVERAGFPAPAKTFVERAPVGDLAQTIDGREIFKLALRARFAGVVDADCKVERARFEELDVGLIVSSGPAGLE